MASRDWTFDVLASLGGEQALRRAVSRGGDLADLFWEEVVLTSLVLEDGRLEKAVSGSEAGVGLRVLFDDRQAFASTNDLAPARLMDLAGIVAAAVAGGRELSLTAVKPGALGPDFITRIPPQSLDTSLKVELLRRAETLARGYDPRIKQVKAIYADRVQKVMVLDSGGRLSGDERVSTLFMVQVVAAAGDRLQTGYESWGGARGFELFEERSPEWVAQTAAARAVLMLDADEAPSGPMPVVLSSEAGGTMIHEAIGHGLEADLAGEGLSVYAGRLGERVASELITVIDDGRLAYRRGSSAVDDEGTPTQSTILVEKGVLKTYMHDRRTALKAGVISTGNGRRESYRHRPVVRMTNTLIAPGETDPEEIIRTTAKGLLVRKMGGGQVNTVNGDFVFEVAEGYLIENGRPGRPVRGATLTGNGPEILKQIDLVGSDLGFAIGTCGKDGQGVPVSDAQPTLRLPEIIVGGRQG
ncbi:MAG: TldD/PmbA family protein [Thermodesulfobacteriota bacterium]